MSLGLLASISKSALLYLMLLFLFSSETMKDGGAIVQIPIEWTGTSSSISLSAEGAIYPNHLNGLPLISIPLGYADVSSFDILKLQKKEVDPALKEKLDFKDFDNVQLVSLKKLKERGMDVSFLEIVPIQYDSVENTYYKVEHIELEYHKISLNSSKANLRTSADTGNSVLATGDWYKIPVLQNGIHKLDYTYLKNQGIDVSGINPKNIQLFGNGGGMLPQSNAEERPIDLIENAIFVSGEADGRFDEADFLLFYGQGPDHKQLNINGELEYQKNYYSDTSFYFLSVGQNEGLRLSEKENLGLDHAKINHFDDFICYEKDEVNIINSGKEWYGEQFDFTLTYDFKFDFPGIVPNTELKVRSSVMGQTYEEASLDLKTNGTQLGQQIINSIVEGSYLAKGSTQVEDFSINTSEFPVSDNFTLRLSFNPTGSGKSKANLNYFTILVKRDLKLYKGQTSFRSLTSTNNAISTFEIEDGGEAFQVWDVTDPIKPYNQKFSVNGNSASFGALTSELSEFIIFKNQEYIIPENAIKIQHQNLRASPNSDFIIITFPGFKDEADRLADLRRNHDGLTVLVVTTNEIYNEFSSGKQDVTAIRDFIKFMYDQGSDDARLQNVLLFGKGSFDYKNRIENNLNFVPIYTSRNSLHPINSYSSDDYYGFLDNNEGEWGESYSGDHLMDIGIGRLPVKSMEEAKVVVDKLTTYSMDPQAYGQWRNELFFIADDGDGNLHQRDADRLANLVDTSYTQFDIRKIYVDAYEQVETSIGETAPEVNAEIERSIEKGGLIFNFTGHGSATRWTSETILNISSASEFENPYRFPLFVTATCEFGRHDNPKAISGAEYLLLNPKGGAIGLLTTARPVFSSTNFILNKAFYKNVFQKEEGKYRSLGEIFRRTKNQSLNGSVNRNFSLLADPSMQLAYAKDEIVLTTDEATDTLKALSTVQLKGKVLDVNGSLNAGFNGTLAATVFDKPTEIITLGHEDAPMKFFVRDNIIFKGEVSVSDGEFDIEFIVPKNITFDFENGKVSMYALDTLQKLDAAGSNIQFVVGGESIDYPPDNTPPEIELFINDTTFVNKGITGQDVIFLGKLSDESGINISSSVEGYELTAMLDGEIESVLNDYYISDIDTYKSGWVTYPYKELSIGTHKIKLGVYDVYNNFSEAEVEFLVVEGENLTIDKLINFPNPFSEYTQFSFEHNRAGDDLEITIDIYSVDGRLVKQFFVIKENSDTRISDLGWDITDSNGSKITSGVYIFNLSIRSLMDGSKKQANQKLVIIN